MATYGVVATGAESGTATTTFTDGNFRVKIEPATIFLHLTWVEHASISTCTCTVRRLRRADDPTSGLPATATIFSDGVPNANSLRSCRAATSERWPGVQPLERRAGFIAHHRSRDSDHLHPRQLHREARRYVANYVANAAPVANDDSLLGERGQQILTCRRPGRADLTTRDAAGNPTDGSLAPARKPPSNGTLTLNANGTFTYTPDANFMAATRSHIARTTASPIPQLRPPSRSRSTRSTTRRASSRAPNETVARGRRRPDGEPAGRRRSAPARPTRAARPSASSSPATPTPASSRRGPR